MKKFLLFFFCFIGFSSSFAETISATLGAPVFYGDYSAVQYQTVDAACSGSLSDVQIYLGYPVGSLTYCGFEEVDVNYFLCKAVDEVTDPVIWDYATCRVSDERAINVYGMQGTYVCPLNQNWTLSGSLCTRPDCLTGQVRLSDGTCSKDCSSKKGQTFTGFIAANLSPILVCQDGCAASIISATNQAAVSGEPVIAGSWLYTGASCASTNVSFGSPLSDPLPDGSSDPQYLDCPAGQCLGTVNGASACYSCGDLGKDAVSYVNVDDWRFKILTTLADGTVTTVVNTRTGDANGDGTISAAESDADGNGIADGTSPVSTTSQKTDQQTFCEQNPTSIMCIDTNDQSVSPVEPTLEASPTGSSIFSAIKDGVLIQPSNFAHISQCPVSSFAWNGQTYIIDQHCALVTNHWGLLSTAMLTAWTVLSLLVVLKA